MKFECFESFIHFADTTQTTRPIVCCVEFKQVIPYTVYIMSHFICELSN